MPNGYHGSAEGWNRLEEPLRQADAAIAAFAERHRIPIDRSPSSWPERSLRWGNNPTRLIQIYLEDETALSWTFWICASEDRGQQRFWKRTFLRRGVQMRALLSELDSLLDEALRVVSSWSSDQLEPATTLRK